MTNRTAAIRYARALLDVAVKEKAPLDQIGEGLVSTKKPLESPWTLGASRTRPSRRVSSRCIGGRRLGSRRRKGVELIDAKQYDQAIAEFSKEVEAAPGEPGAYRDRGTAYRVARCATR